MRTGAPVVPMLPEAAAVAAATEVGLPRSFHHLHVFRVLLHAPRVAKGISGLLVSQMKDPVLDERLRELIIMRVAWVTGSEYEWSQHWGISERLGLDAEEVAAVRDWPSVRPADDRAIAVLAATDEILERGCLSPATLTRCVDVLGGEDQAVAVVTAVGTWSMISTLLRTFSVPLDPDVDSWPPDGARPDPHGERHR